MYIHKMLHLNQKYFESYFKRKCFEAKMLIFCQSQSSLTSATPVERFVGQLAEAVGFVD